MISLAISHVELFPWNSRILCHLSKIYNNKAVEFQINKDDSTLLAFLFKFNIKGDHAGIYFSIGLFGFTLMVEFYDRRHWDYKTNCWKVYGLNENV